MTSRLILFEDILLEDMVSSCCTCNMLPTFSRIWKIFVLLDERIMLKAQDGYRDDILSIKSSTERGGWFAQRSLTQPQNDGWYYFSPADNVILIFQIAAIVLWIFSFSSFFFFFSLPLKKKNSYLFGKVKMPIFSNTLMYTEIDS